MLCGMENYTIVRSRRRTVALEVTRDARVLVRAPQRMPETRIAAFVRAHEDWLAAHLEAQRRRLEAAPPPTAEELAALRAEARRILPPKVAYYARLMGVTPTHITITAARTRFGSCSAKNALSFSCLLLRYPEEAVDLVVVHELAHIRHHNHGPEFYALLGQVLPDHRERKELLREPPVR